MKYTVNFVMLILLAGCASEKIAFSGKEYDSAVDLTKHFYDVTYAGDKKAKFDGIRSGGKAREFKFFWCMNEAATKEDYLNKINENCNLNGGFLIKNKWCVAKNKDALKYLVEIGYPSSSSLSVRAQVETCKSPGEIGIYVWEASPARSTAKPLIASCPKPRYPIQSERVREQGVTVVDLFVPGEGKIIAKVQKSSGFPRLDDAAVRSFGNCVYVPKIEKGVPVDGVTEVTMEWRLKDTVQE